MYLIYDKMRHEKIFLSILSQDMAFSKFWLCRRLQIQELHIF